MISVKARVIAHEVVVYPRRVHVGVLYLCPFCAEGHGAAWHSPSGEAVPKFAGCNGEEFMLTWPDIPGDVSAALLEFRPDILGRSDLVATPEPNDGSL